jgi:thiol-disulfide isomerase/thioredoxin
MNNDTMYQYEKDYLNKYEINNLNDQSILTLTSIPTGYKVQDYVPFKNPIPLPKDSLAPNWKLLSLSDKEISLTDFKGRVVLIDFFYRSCYPCMQALPALQALHDKYHDKGLTVIGIDPYDKKDDNLSSFLAKRGVTYTVLLGGKDVAKDYRVSGYPTMYLIDKNGKVIFNQVGYGKGIEYLLEKVILDNL